MTEEEREHRATQSDSESGHLLSGVGVGVAMLGFALGVMVPWLRPTQLAPPPPVETPVESEGTKIKIGKFSVTFGRDSKDNQLDDASDREDSRSITEKDEVIPHTFSTAAPVMLGIVGLGLAIGGHLRNEKTKTCLVAGTLSLAAILVQYVLVYVAIFLAIILVIYIVGSIGIP